MAFTFSSPFVASISFSSVYTNYILPWWEQFLELFVGEDLWIQLGVAVGAFVLAYARVRALRPYFRKMEEAIEERDDWVEGSFDWASANLFRVLLVGLLWSASLYFDGRIEESRSVGNEAAEVIEDLDTIPNGAEVEDAASESAAVVLNIDTAEGDVADPGVDIVEIEAVSGKNYILLRAFASIATLLLVSGALPRRIKKQAYYKMLFFILAVGLILNLLGVWAAIRDGLNVIKLLPISDSRETQVTALTLLKGR